MTNDNGNLSIDFLVGFTVFILAFIWVVSMIPGLLIGLQSYSIDYDAVAYRTGVILTEDPGWPASPAWESYGDPQKFNITRFGLAISKDTPNILSQDKINRFFNISTTNPSVGFIYPDDYHQRAIFGDYPYNFKISLRDINEVRKRSVGERLPEGYGSIRRVVKIKGTSNATINESYSLSHGYIKSDNATTHVFSMLINNTKLLGDIRNPAYQIDTSREQILINITDLKSTITEFPTAVPPITRATSSISLEDMKIYKLDAGIYSNIPLPASNNPFIDGNSTRLPSFPANVNENITVKLNPQYIDSMKAQNSQIYITLQFNVTPASTFLNNTRALPDINNFDGKLSFENASTTPFIYDYNPANVTQPTLRDAILEVAVWSGNTGLESIEDLFSDDFEGSHTWIENPSSGIDWDVNFPCVGTCIRARDENVSIQRTISTIGYSSISVSFDMGASFSPGNSVAARWSPDGGTTWNILKQINDNDPEDDNTLHPFTYSLPAGADNNPAFTLGFALAGANPGDKAYIDNIVVGGMPN